MKTDEAQSPGIGQATGCRKACNERAVSVFCATFPLAIHPGPNHFACLYNQHVKLEMSQKPWPNVPAAHLYRKTFSSRCKHAPCCAHARTPRSMPNSDAHLICACC